MAFEYFLIHGRTFVTYGKEAAGRRKENLWKSGAKNRVKEWSSQRRSKSWICGNQQKSQNRKSLEITFFEEIQKEEKCLVEKVRAPPSPFFQFKFFPHFFQANYSEEEEDFSDEAEQESEEGSHGYVVELAKSGRSTVSFFFA